MTRKRACRGLYCSEDEVAEVVLGPGRLRDWRDRVPVLERQGMPRIDPLMGGRYLPAVLAWFQRLNGVSGQHIPIKADGEEHFECLTPRKAKSSTSQPATPPGSSGATAKTVIGSPPKKL
jgi:hypothetical protein